MRIITVNLPVSYINAIKILTGEGGLYPSRSELIRVAVREFLILEIKNAQSFTEFQSKLTKSSKDKEEFEIDIDNILGIKKDEIEFSKIKYPTMAQEMFQKLPTIKPEIENSGSVVDLGDNRLKIDGKVFNVK